MVFCTPVDAVDFAITAPTGSRGIRDPPFAESRKTPEYAAVRAGGVACQQRCLAHRAEVAR
jgi:hypothetical protein